MPVDWAAERKRSIDGLLRRPNKVCGDPATQKPYILSAWQKQWSLSKYLRSVNDDFEVKTIKKVKGLGMGSLSKKTGK